MGAIFSVPRRARARRVAELPGETVALVARAGEPLRGPRDGAATLLVGAEREGLPDERRGGMRPHRPHPDRLASR